MTKSKRLKKKKAVFGRIVWALDPFSGTRRLQEKALPLLRALTEGTTANVEPVYLVGPNAFQLPAAIFADSTSESTNELKKKLVHYVESLSLSISPPRILGSFPFSPSLREGVQRLLSYVKKNSVDLIVLTSRAKKGMPRFFLGSFAETLLLRTTVPVLLINPVTASPRKLKRIFFATELRGGDLRGLSQCVALAKHMNCDIAIFHKLATPLRAPYWPVVPEFLESEKERCMKELARLALWSKKQGIEADVIFDMGNEDVATTITKNAKAVEGTLVVISPQVGPVSAHFLGSTTFKVVRSSASPVLIMPPRGPKGR